VISLSDGVLEHLREIADAPNLADTKYELEELIGRGGMGSVYRVYDRELGRQVALKVLSAPDPNGALATRLLLEAKILARLEHPGIVPVYDAGRLADGRAFCVMKWVQGMRLDTWLDSSPSTLARLQLLHRICETVAFAHAHGVIHRDLKPENIMIGSFGQALVMDWGVAKQLGTHEPSSDTSSGAARALTGHGAIIGTTTWMSPEQSRGEPADEKSDVFALGKILAFVAADGAPPALRAIIARAAAPLPVERYPGAVELAADIQRFLDGDSVAAYRESWVGRLNRLSRPYRPLLALLFVYAAVRLLILFLTGV
jgi:serine/threonine protein kinase